MFLAQLVHNQVLREVGVLILVNKDVAEKFLIALQHLGIVAQQQVGVEQQVVKVHCPCNAASVPVGLVDGGRLGTLGIAVSIHQGLIAGIVLRRDERVLGIADLSLDACWLIDFVVQPHVLNNEFDERTGIALVIDGEIGLEADEFGIAAQQAGKDGVERAHPQLGCHIGACQRLDALTHLACGLVGERERHDAPWFIALMEQVHDLIGQHTRLSRPRTGNHQLRPVAILDRGALLVVQFLQIIFIHGCKNTNFFGVSSGYMEQKSGSFRSNVQCHRK